LCDTKNSLAELSFNGDASSKPPSWQGWPGQNCIARNDSTERSLPSVLLGVAEEKIVSCIDIDVVDRSVYEEKGVNYYVNRVSE